MAARKKSKAQKLAEEATTKALGRYGEEADPMQPDPEVVKKFAEDMLKGKWTNEHITPEVVERIEKGEGHTRAKQAFNTIESQVVTITPEAARAMLEGELVEPSKETSKYVPKVGDLVTVGHSAVLHKVLSTHGNWAKLQYYPGTVHFANLTPAQYQEEPPEVPAKSDKVVQWRWQSKDKCFGVLYIRTANSEAEYFVEKLSSEWYRLTKLVQGQTITYSVRLSGVYCGCDGFHFSGEFKTCKHVESLQALKKRGKL